MAEMAEMATASEAPPPVVAAKQGEFGAAFVEETGGALSDVSRARIARGAGRKGRVAVFCGPYQTAATQSVAVAHDLVHDADLDLPKRFNKSEAARLAAASEKTAIRTTIKKKKPRKRVPTVTLSTEFVPLASLRDAAWRQEHMHLWPHAKLVADLVNSF